MYVVTMISLHLSDQSAPYLIIKLRKFIAQIKKHWLSLSQNHIYLKNH
jgi:hypothetical protein